eukprot:c9877_g1_i1.p1 GENE.c9877_g1_i1~~c9877_g1_i1.p1  ORF type:complete len:245 (-),score=41.03 c9877_g1_i1:44-742(-)
MWLTKTTLCGCLLFAVAWSPQRSLSSNQIPKSTIIASAVTVLGLPVLLAAIVVFVHARHFYGSKKSIPTSYFSPLGVALAMSCLIGFCCVASALSVTDEDGRPFHNTSENFLLVTLLFGLMFVGFEAVIAFKRVLVSDVGWAMQKAAEVVLASSAFTASVSSSAKFYHKGHCSQPNANQEGCVAFQVGIACSWLTFWLLPCKLVLAYASTHRNPPAFYTDNSESEQRPLADI